MECHHYSPDIADIKPNRCVIKRNRPTKKILFDRLPVMGCIDKTH